MSVIAMAGKAEQKKNEQPKPAKEKETKAKK